MRHNNQNSQLPGSCPDTELLTMLTGSSGGEVGKPGFDQTFLERIRDVCKAEAASVWVLDSRSRLELMLSTDITATEDVKKVRKIGLTKGDGISGRTVLRRATQTLSSKDDVERHDDRIDTVLRRKTRSMISSPIVWGSRNVYGVLNVINVAEEKTLDDLKETVEIAARLYAQLLLRVGCYHLPSYEEVASRYPYLVYDPSGPLGLVIENCERYAPHDETVLLLGETGTGKELLARVIYEASKRPGPFLAMNCGATDHTLMRSELFGYVKGAFTGAENETLGFMGDVGKGTLFLDEIGSLPADCQPMLLRVLDKGKYNRVGETEEKQFKGRIIAATQPSLRDKVRNGQFMEDLAYRLERFHVQVPALRDCPSDIRLLLEHFLDEKAKKFGQTRPVFTKDARRRFLSYSWPGNVRQMESVVSDATVLFPGGEIDEVKLDGLLKRHDWSSRDAFADISRIQASGETGTSEQRLRVACRDPQNRFTSGGINIKKVASALGLDRHTASKRIKELGIA